MRIGLIDIDYNGSFPNIPLMKISAWYKSQGNTVEWYLPFSDRYDTVYISKVFSWSEDYKDAINADNIICGGTGYQIDNLDGREFFNSNPSSTNRMTRCESMTAYLADPTTKPFWRRNLTSVWVIKNEEIYYYIVV